MNKYGNLTVLNGILLAIMIFLNGVLSKQVGLYISTLIYHILGLILVSLAAILLKNKLPKFNKIPLFLFAPGILSVFVILLNSLSSSKIGVTLTAGMGLFGQLVLSTLIDHFGLFNMSARKIRKENLLSFSIIITGLILLITL